MMMDFNEQLKNQITFLENSILLFQSCEVEAIRIATTIRVLVHDTNNSTSLLKHLNTKSNTDYIDTSSPKDAFAYFNISGANVDIDESLLRNTPYAGLVAKDIVKNDDNLVLKFKPIFYQRSESGSFPRVSFEDWWDGEVYDNKNGKVLSRKKLVLAASNKDGGAHVDANVPDNYEAIKNENHVDIKIDGAAESFSNVPLYSSLCQVGWELLYTLKARA